ncbi:MAG: class I SAM-dependent methyltransferase [Gemmatimonadaceae bacterium]|nr:class I SAM-dependent methyltransferase [Gemmatimonadaceae bacterium]
MASEYERAYISIMSSREVVQAYAAWDDISEQEQLAIADAVISRDRVLDVGCGAGRFTRLLSGKCACYVGLDIIPMMLDATKSRSRDAWLIQADATQLPFANGAFDVGLVMHNGIDALHPISRREALLSAVRDVLSAAGRLVFSTHLLRPDDRVDIPGYVSEDYHGHQVLMHRTTEDACRAELRSAGFNPRTMEVVRKRGKAEWIYVSAEKQTI